VESARKPSVVPVRSASGGLAVWTRQGELAILLIDLLTADGLRSAALIRKISDIERSSDT
jgi:hypothetical protein